MADCCGSMMKYIVFLCNFVFFVTGAAVIAVGVVLHTSMRNYYDFVDDNYMSSSVVLMIGGSVILLVAFFGCCGTCTESPCMIYTFATLLALILIAEAAVAAIVIAYKSTAWNLITDKFVSGLNNYGQEDEAHAGMTNAWDAMQGKLQCCGVNSYEDWANVTSVASGDVPDSCCVQRSPGCGAGAMMKPSSIHQEGCLAKLKGFINDHAVIAIVIAAGVSLLQLVSVAIACGLANKMGQVQKYV